MTCDMGQAIPSLNKNGWYNNKEIPGLQLKLIAKAAFMDKNSQIKPMGFVIIVKNNDILYTFKPLGSYENGQWQGDVFNSWSAVNTDISVYSELYGKSGFAKFDLLDGNGFFYKTDKSETPDYFLSNCQRIKAQRLPIYD